VVDQSMLKVSDFKPRNRCLTDFAAIVHQWSSSNRFAGIQTEHRARIHNR
jgi:hypothetical protein